MSSKENDYDALGARMKRYEAVANGQLLIPDLPLYFRIDGRHFSKLTKNLGYPYKDLPDEKRSFVFSQLMQMTAYSLMKEFNCDIIETHSDEINGGFRSIKTAPFDGKYFKLVSNIASYASTAFMSSLFNFFGDGSILDSEKERNDLAILQKEYPSFDCRIVQLPNLMELVNCFIWRQNDCIRGAINQYAQRWFNHKELLGKTQDDRIEMLSNAGHRVMDIEPYILYGHWLIKKTSIEKIDPKYAQFHPGESTMARTKIDLLNLDYRLAGADDKLEILFPNNKNTEN